MSDKLKNIFIIAGESSGEMHAASLIKEIKLLSQDYSFYGIGGPEMKKEGVHLFYEISEVNFFGFSTVLRNIKKIKSIFNKSISRLKELNPPFVILVDYPGFNLKFATAIRKFYKGKIIYYISPQLWAWHKSRVKIIKQSIDMMIVVFPFEVDFYKKENINVLYGGHPLVKRINDFLQHNFKGRFEKFQIGILPGSRKDEIERMLPILVEAGESFKNEFPCEINIICSPNYSETFYEKYTNGKDVNLIYDKNDYYLNYKAILNSDLIITKSGTSTMECALIGTPFCVVYKTGKINYVIGKSLINVKSIAMVNILSGKEIVKEFIQDQMTVDNILTEGKRILFDNTYTEEMKKHFIELKTILTDEDASANAAKAILNFVEED